MYRCKNERSSRDEEEGEGCKGEIDRPTGWLFFLVIGEA